MQPGSGGEKKRRDPLRNVRVNDELWAAFKVAAEDRGAPSLSHIIRGALTNYVRATDRMRARGALPGQQRSEPNDQEDTA